MLEDLGRQADHALDRLERARADRAIEPPWADDIVLPSKIDHTAPLERLRDLIRAADAERERLIREAINEGVLSERAVAMASGLSAPAVARRRS